MINKKCTWLLAALLLGSGATGAAETDFPPVCGADCRDISLSSLLLAAGMYGSVDGHSYQGIDFSQNRSQKMLAGPSLKEGKTDTQDITLSYHGSSGRLGFSAGYLYTDLEENQEKGTVSFGWDALYQDYAGNTEKPWYVTLNLEHSFQFSNEIALGVGSKTMLLSPPLDDKETEGRSMCMLINLPVSYKGFLTVTPEVQWSIPLSGEQPSSGPPADAFSADSAFYGGMSVTLSY